MSNVIERASTPSCSWKIPFDPGIIRTAIITCKQCDKTVFEVKGDAIHIDKENRIVSCEFTQEQTRLLEAEMQAAIQLRIISVDGKTSRSQVEYCYVRDVLNDEVYHV